MIDLFPPPERLSWYYVPDMLAAEAGTLRYDHHAYPIHSVSNNVAMALWHGLLADAEDGPVLTILGRRLLEEWKASPEGCELLAVQAAEDAELAAERPAPMTAEQAAWVRAHVWTAAIRRDWPGPGEVVVCACQYGPSTWCLQDRCGRCERADDLPYPETFITDAQDRPLSFREPYAHPHRTATGLRPAREAMVWLADRVCRWRCPCACHHMPAQDVLFEVD